MKLNIFFIEKGVFESVKLWIFWVIGSIANTKGYQNLGQNPKHAPMNLSAMFGNSCLFLAIIPFF
ncbi:MAG: hypothetical protein EAZ50_10185 [Runella slithyformis]|nr:MAG: hypothetical protein EAZ50_10185 [Runella slithyformis]